MSGVFLDPAKSKPLLIAGGGGGGGGDMWQAVKVGGGAGGGISGKPAMGRNPAGAGNQDRGGKPWGEGRCSGEPGARYQGGAGAFYEPEADKRFDGGGGGGGGWYGGAGGGCISKSKVTTVDLSGGGGSGYVAPYLVISALMEPGSYADRNIPAPSGGSFDPHYRAGIGLGGSYTGDNDANGGDGEVVLQW